MILWNDQDFHLLFYSIRLCFFFAPQTFCFVQEILILCSLQAVDIGLEDNSDEQLNTRLLPGQQLTLLHLLVLTLRSIYSIQLDNNYFTGEAVVAEAQNVLMYAPVSEKQGKSGILTVTNFKLSFVTTEERHREVRPLFYLI